MKYLFLVLALITMKALADCRTGYYIGHKEGAFQTVCYYDVLGSEVQLVIDTWGVCPTTHYFCSYENE